MGVPGEVGAGPMPETGLDEDAPGGPVKAGKDA
jgi:hypothetical protein